ncbi:MAG: hypothetical protein AB7V22_07115 [Kiritimatiellia bacterium]
MSMDAEKSVAAVVWAWRDPAAAAGPAAPAPAGAALRQAAVMAVVGAGLFFGLEHRAMGIVVWSLAGVVLAAGLFLPAVFFAFERLGRQLGKGVGVLLTWGLLVPFYYLCFGTLRLAQKIGGKDPLCRKFPSDEPTYWTPRQPVRDMAQYRKQF